MPKKVSFAAEGMHVPKSKRMGFRVTKAITQKLKAAKPADRPRILSQAREKHRTNSRVTKPKR